MAKTSAFKMALRGAAVAGLLLVSVAPSEAAWGQRFSFLRNNQVSTQSSFSSWRWALIQRRAVMYRAYWQRFFGPVSPFSR